jgi:hypothetical protein
LTRTSSWPNFDTVSSTIRLQSSAPWRSATISRIWWN